MLFEQKSRRKSNVEIEVCPYKCLTNSISSQDFHNDFLPKAIKMDEQNFTHKKGVGKNFSVFFCRRRFSRGLNECPIGVLGG